MSEQKTDLEMEGKIAEPTPLQVEDIYPKLEKFLEPSVKEALNSNTYASLQGEGFVIRFVGMRSAGKELTDELLKNFSSKLSEIHSKYEIRGNMSRAIKLDLVEKVDLAKGVGELMTKYQPTRFMVLSYVALDPNKVKAFDEEIQALEKKANATS